MRPVQVGVRDDLVRRRGSPRAVVLRRVGVADGEGVVAADNCPVERGSDALVALGACDDEPPDAEARQYRLERGLVEGVWVAPVDERLAVARSQVGDDLPVVAASNELFVCQWPSAAPRRPAPGPVASCRPACRCWRRPWRAGGCPRRRRPVTAHARRAAPTRAVAPWPASPAGSACTARELSDCGGAVEAADSVQDARSRLVGLPDSSAASVARYDVVAPRNAARSTAGWRTPTVMRTCWVSVNPP